jgi:membrane-associated protease RseP (regulator of RpoE activity)
MSHKRTLLIPLLLALVSLGAAEPRGWLGIYSKELDSATEAALGVTHGVMLTRVVDKSPAAEIGLKVGDVILKIDSEEVLSVNDLSELIGDKPGKTVQIEYLRLGKTETAEARLGTRESQLELNVPDLPELNSALMKGQPNVRILADDYMKDIRDLREEIAILRKDIERLRKEIQKLKK